MDAKGVCLHNSVCAQWRFIQYIQVGWKFEATTTDKCSVSNKNAFVYINQADKSTSVSVIFRASLSAVFLMIMKPIIV